MSLLLLPPPKHAGMQGQIDPGYLQAASYLAEVGFTNKTEIARVLDIAMNPSSLFVQASVNVNARPLTVEADMRPVVEYLQSQGVSAGDIVKVCVCVLGPHTERMRIRDRQTGRGSRCPWAVSVKRTAWLLLLHAMHSRLCSVCKLVQRHSQY